MIEPHKKFGLVAASVFLALVLLMTFVNFVHGQVVPGPPTLVSPENNENINNNTPFMDWSYVPRANNYHIQIDNDSDYSSPNVDDPNVGFLSQYMVPNENALPDG